jgi:hypothetical protein
VFEKIAKEKPKDVNKTLLGFGLRVNEPSSLPKFKAIGPADALRVDRIEPPRQN